MAAQPMSGIYEIVNLVNGKRYVGSAKNFVQRWYIHRRALVAGKHHSRHLQRAWNKHGSDAFEFREIEVCEPQDLIEREQQALDRIRPEYNVATVAGSTLGVKYTDQGRANISAALKGKRKGVPRSRESVEKTAAGHRGRKRSEETRARIAEKAAGRAFVRHNDDYRAKLSAALKGKAKSPEQMAALQAGRARRVFTEEQRASISATLRAQYADGSRSRKRPPEYREKIASTLRAQSASPDVRDRLRKQAAAAWAERPEDERRQHMEKVRAARKRRAPTV